MYCWFIHFCIVHKFISHFYPICFAFFAFFAARFHRHSFSSTINHSVPINPSISIIYQQQNHVTNELTNTVVHYNQLYKRTANGPQWQLKWNQSSARKLSSWDQSLYHAMEAILHSTVRSTTVLTALLAKTRHTHLNSIYHLNHTLPIELCKQNWKLGARKPPVRWVHRPKFPNNQSCQANEGSKIQENFRSTSILKSIHQSWLLS